MPSLGISGTVPNCWLTEAPTRVHQLQPRLNFYSKQLIARTCHQQERVALLPATELATIQRQLVTLTRQHQHNRGSRTPANPI